MSLLHIFANSKIQSQSSTYFTGRESDASFCSSRPSIASIGRTSTALPNISDRSYQSSALRTINSYLASQSVPFSLKHPLPSAKDITETLKLLLHRLGFASQKIDEDLSHALKFLKCPLKLNKSAARPGDDEAMDALDEECVREMREWRDKKEEDVRVLEEEVKELEAKLDGLRTGPSQKEVLEQEKAVLEKDVTKFHIMIEQLDGHLTEMQKKLEEKDKALVAKVEDRKRICEENEELKKRIEEQGINLRDAERMKRELQAVDRDIEEMEGARNGWEEKIWELDSEIGHKFKELERLVMECNQAIRRDHFVLDEVHLMIRLKIGNGFQYQLNASGSTPSESGENAAKLEEKQNRIAVLQSHIDEALFSISYKACFLSKDKGLNNKICTTWDAVCSLQALSKLDININHTSMEKWPSGKKKESSQNMLGGWEVIYFGSVIQVIAASVFNAWVEAQLNIIRKGIHEYTSRCGAEARKLAEEVDVETQNMSVVEKEAAEFLKTSKAELQETIIRTEEEVKLCAQELFDLINSVSTYKEYVGSKIARMKNDLLETAGAVADIYKGYRPSQGCVVPFSSN
ncbi:hypothetical protein DH2020_011183 [Rehmannia glutinosa]|uniref:Kinetochore protein NDC80 n=1 Tax=Rehmannia glutinosa TaxID=99300 RepID=A0ABR0XCW1_REHGL